MFTGLIETLGRVVDNQPLQSGCRLTIDAAFDAVQPGESIAVNGVCLTVLPFQEKPSFDVSPETLRLTTLGELKPGQLINLERALLAGSRMGGHYVSGHVDTMASVLSVRSEGEFVELTISDFGLHAAPYLLPKGSITLDGVSLTINTVVQDTITVMLVPHTLAMTTFGSVIVGQRVNVEFDYLARIIAHQLVNMMPRTTTI
jgi:riboflavin synthase